MSVTEKGYENPLVDLLLLLIILTLSEPLLASKGELCSVTLLSSSSSSPSCRVFILIFLRQTMSLEKTVL